MLSIKRYQLSDIITYLSCPLKYDYQGRTNIPLHDHDGRMLISSALKSTYIKCFQMIGSRRPWSQKQAMAFFSRTWHLYREELKKNNLAASSNTKYLLEAHDKILNFKFLVPQGWEVAVTEYPTERKIKDFIIEDVIDVILVKRNSNDINILFLDSSACEESNNNYAIHLRALINLSIFRKELGHSNLNVSSSVLNTYYNYKKTLNISLKSKINYPRIVSSIVDSIERKIKYPIANAETCKYCIYNNLCFWRNN